jgi:hypothetical protein
VTDELAALRAEADAPDEGLVGVVISLDQELLARLTARGSEALLVSQRPPEPHAEDVELAREAQVLA